ncbi:FUSC family protein [Streptomyces sp. TRM 70351]|uniref:FUSC family protein n=1 Tax=Streptomyces sp. TRM 70351 TaxID=3116552 RepID=UPI002E7B8CAC|nr:FUSC family protein [Streptomyces sp. TRM 70351]MEE1928232.1 FUSC family protein [Streptomyces sp. TRM 70351]
MSGTTARWAAALAETARSGLRVERASLTPLLAVRGACGVALVIGLTLWLGSATLAVSSAFGAFASGIATFQRSWRPRPELALAAAAGLSVSAFLGYVLAGHPAAFTVMLALWAFGAGMAWVAGPTPGVVAAFTVAMMLVVVTLPSSVPEAAQHAGIIALGGLAQAGLIVVFPVRRWGARREALADALAGVADYARRLREEPTAPFDPQPLVEAREAAAVTPRQARRRPRQLHGYRLLAERFRPVLASLADPVLGGAAREGPERDRVRALLAAAATVLDGTARAIRRGEHVRVPREALDVLQVPEDGPALPPGPARKAALRLIALSGEAVEAAQEPVEVTAVGHRPYLRRATGPGQLAVVLRAVRRELRPASPVFRHALRLAAVVATGYLLGGALPTGHGYWIGLTAVMVLRPDFSGTVSRGAARLAGTVAGVVVGGAVIALLGPGPGVAAGLAVVSVFLLYLLMRTGFMVISACAGAYVVFLLGIVGTNWSQTVPERMLLTLVGGVLALVSYGLYPAWETPRLRERLADWLTASCGYAVAVLDAYGTPGERHTRVVREALLDNRAALLEWEQATARAGAEPVRHRGLPRRRAAEAQAALTTVGRSGLLLEAHLPEPGTPGDPGAAAFAGALRDAVARAAPAVRAGAAPDWAPVHRALARWRRDARHPDGIALRAAELVTDALDELAKALTPR